MPLPFLNFLSQLDTLLIYDGTREKEILSTLKKYCKDKYKHKKHSIFLIDLYR